MSYETRRDRRRALKEKLARRERVFTGWLSFADAGIAEIFARAGFDMLAVDLEHMTLSAHDAKAMITAGQAEGAVCLPRIVGHAVEDIKPLLDAGADGLLAPLVNRPEQVEDLISALKYPPLGARTYGIARAQGFGQDFAAYTQDWNDTSLLILQIETVEAVENIDAMLAYAEVDAVMVSPTDLSGSLGVPGQTDHPSVKAAARAVIEAAERAGKSVCTQLGAATPETVSAAFAEGYTFLILSSDIFALLQWSQAATEIMATWRQETAN